MVSDLCSVILAASLLVVIVASGEELEKRANGLQDSSPAARVALTLKIQNG